jgi:hypothetical protein
MSFKVRQHTVASLTPAAQCEYKRTFWKTWWKLYNLVKMLKIVNWWQPRLLLSSDGNYTWWFLRGSSRGSLPAC